MSTSEVITMASAYKPKEYLHYQTGLQPMELGMHGVASQVQGGHQAPKGNVVDTDSKEKEKTAQACDRKLRLSDFKLITTLGYVN